MMKLTSYVKMVLVWLKVPLIVVVLLLSMGKNLVTFKNEELAQNQSPSIAIDLGQLHLVARECSSDFALIVAISKLEGCYAWNNPTCLLYAHQRGASRNRLGYATFSNREAGWQAAFLLVRNYRKRGLFDRDIAKRWNPDAGDSYIERVLRGCK